MGNEMQIEYGLCVYRADSAEGKAEEEGLRAQIDNLQGKVEALKNEEKQNSEAREQQIQDEKVRSEIQETRINDLERLCIEKEKEAKVGRAKLARGLARNIVTKV